MVLRNIDEEITKEYLFAFLKTDFFLEQILGFENRGMYPRLDKDSKKNVYIPIPKKKLLIDYITVLVKAYLNKEALIRHRYETILKTIEDELINNQNPNSYKYDYPKFKEINRVCRLDTNLYTNSFKKQIFLIHNYLYGYSTISTLGFTLSRGQNLQVSNIGKSIYSVEKHENFYTLVLPKFLSKYGTVNTVEYLGNAKELKTLQNGDIIFGAEGFEKGRSIVVLEEQERTITNIHGITIQQEEKDVVKGIFVKCFLDYLRSKGLIDLFAVGGNGGSLAQKYWEQIPFANFNKIKQEEIALLYHNPNIEFIPENSTLDTFLTYDDTYNKLAGIYELDKTAKILKSRLNQIIDAIVNDRKVDMKFDF